MFDLGPYLENFNKEIVGLAFIVALLQNVFVDMFKAGDKTHFKQTGANLQGAQAKWYNILILALSGVIVFCITFFAGNNTAKDSIIGAILTTVFAWTLYRGHIYDFLMGILETLKTSITDFIKSKFSSK